MSCALADLFGEYMRFIMIIIVALVMAMVMFGKNPVKEMQQKAIEMRKKYGSDPLTQETNIYIEKQKRQTPVSVGGIGRAGVAPAEGVPNADVVKDGLSRPSTGGGYYPPVVVDNNHETAGGAIEQGAVSVNKLRSGQAIAFEGMNVYAVGKDGKKTQLPDGKYTLYDGDMIEIYGGRRILTGGN